MITVPELNDAAFSYLKLSPDADNEFYMFASEASCKAYGNKFNPDVEAAFIRSPGTGCKPCKSCGKVKSVMITDAKEDTKKADTKTSSDKKVQDSSASSVEFSSAAVVVSAAVAMLF